MIKCGPNRVSLVWQEEPDFSDEPRRAPGTGLINKRGRPFPPHPPFPPPQFGHNRMRRETLISEHSTGTVFADGFSVELSGCGEATAIRVFG